MGGGRGGGSHWLALCTSTGHREGMQWSAVGASAEQWWARGSTLVKSFIRCLALFR